MNGIMLKCGCVADAIDGKGQPCCIIHKCTEQIKETIDLTDRKAKCVYCHKVEDSNPDRLPFFRFKGVNSEWAKTSCKKCWYHKEAHDNGKVDCDFEPAGPAEYDQFYCGCRGWN